MRIEGTGCFREIILLKDLDLYQICLVFKTQMLKMNLKVFENVDIIFTVHLINLSSLLISNIEFSVDLYFLREVLKMYMSAYLK